MMTPAEIEKLFTRADGTYGFARWGRPIVPVVFGVDEATLTVVKGAVEAVCTLAGHHMDELDGELGSNMMVFFMRDWAELLETPKLDELIPELATLVPRLQAADATQYRIFRFDKDNAIQACFMFIRMTDELMDMPADTLALGQMVQSIVTWGDGAFSTQSPLAIFPDTGALILRPEIADLIRAAYDPIMPVAADDASHALRLFARMGTIE